MNGGSITSEATGVNADLSHNGTLVMGTIDDIGTRGDGSGGKGDPGRERARSARIQPRGRRYPYHCGHGAGGGKTLSVDTSGISDTDGIVNSILTYQWIANDGTETRISRTRPVLGSSLLLYRDTSQRQVRNTACLCPPTVSHRIVVRPVPQHKATGGALSDLSPSGRSSIRRAKGSPRHGPSTQRTVSCDCLDCESQYAPPQMSQTGCSVFQRSYALPIDTHGIIRFSMSSTSLVES